MFREPSNSMVLLVACVVAAVLAGAGMWILATSVIAVSLAYVAWASRPIS